MDPLAILLIAEAVMVWAATEVARMRGLDRGRYFWCALLIGPLAIHAALTAPRDDVPPAPVLRSIFDDPPVPEI